MSDIVIRIEGHAGRITLNRPEALNALSYEMCLALDRALRDWQDDAAVALVVIDAAGPRAFCAGGDIARLYAEGRAGNFGHGQQFWRDEYRMNLRIADYPKPVVTLMQGFAMGGGVGVGCHASHRIVGESAQLAMPECGIGLVPDVGGSGLLARAPGRLGAYLGTTGQRMGPADAIFAGFADHFVPEAEWPEVVRDLAASGSVAAIAAAVAEPPAGWLAAVLPQIDRWFADLELAAVVARLRADPGNFAAETLTALARVSPLAAGCTLEMQRRLGPCPDLRAALELEYRFSHRAQADGDFLEGIRAAIIDKDRKPQWQHALTGVPQAAITHMLAPLGPLTLQFTE